MKCCNVVGNMEKKRPFYSQILKLQISMTFFSVEKLFSYSIKIGMKQ